MSETTPDGHPWRRGRTIPWRELTFKQDPAGGPGGSCCPPGPPAGQHANKSATRVTLSWRPFASEALRADEKARLREEWSTRLTQTGILRIRIGDERSARQNRERCLESLAALLSAALAPRRTRRETAPTRASRERRIEDKRGRARKKEQRRRPAGEE
jgi:ribosome-associated protein